MSLQNPECEGWPGREKISPDVPESEMKAIRSICRTVQMTAPTYLCDPRPRRPWESRGKRSYSDARSRSTEDRLTNGGPQASHFQAPRSGALTQPVGLAYPFGRAVAPGTQRIMTSVVESSVVRFVRPHLDCRGSDEHAVDD